MHPSLDIATIRITTPSTCPHQPPFKTIALGPVIHADEPVTAIGWPGTINPRITKGKVISVDRYSIVFDAHIDYGNSGSPLLNRDREAVGVIIKQFTEQQGGRAIPIAHARAMMR